VGFGEGEVFFLRSQHCEAGAIGGGLRAFHQGEHLVELVDGFSIDRSGAGAGVGDGYRRRTQDRDLAIGGQEIEIAALDVRGITRITGMALVGPSSPLTGTRRLMRWSGAQISRSAALAMLTASARFNTSAETPATPRQTIEVSASSWVAQLMEAYAMRIRFRASGSVVVSLVVTQTGGPRTVKADRVG
jgi:hypothetical protein